MKKTAAFLCALMLVFGMPSIAFGESSDVAAGIKPSAILSDLGATDKTEADNTYIVNISKANLKSGSDVAGVITGLTITIPNRTADKNFGGPNTTVAPTPYAVDASKTVLNAAAFSFTLALNFDPKPTIPDGASIVYTYQAYQNLVNDLAKKNDIKPSDIKLYVYEEDMDGKVQKLVNDWPSDKPVEVKTDDLRTGDFVMALACDTALLNKAKSNSASSETFVGIDPVEMDSTLLIATGKDDSDASPKTGQAVPAETAPLALLATGVLGATAVFASRRRSAR